MMKRYINMLFACLILSGCMSNDRIFYNESLEKILESAQKHSEPFYCMLTDGDSQLSTVMLPDNAIVNLCDVGLPGNSWYLKWLDSPELPLLCKFSANGELEDTEHIVTGKHEDAGTIELFNRILKHRQYIILGADVSDDIDNTIVLKNYPYPYYQKLLCKSMSDDRFALEEAAYAFLDFKFLDKYSELYRKEFMVADAIVRNEYGNGPKISLSDDTIRLSAAREGQTKKIGIKLKNIGNEPMMVSHVTTGCSCVIPLSDGVPGIVMPNESLSLDFNVIMENEEMHRGIIVISDAINAPVSKITITIKKR